ncbi:MAG: hypothetical protein ACUVTZ_01475 [Armatimonadota bacterium]
MTAFVSTDHLKDCVVTFTLTSDPGWDLLSIAVFAVWVVLEILKRHTTILTETEIGE